MSRMSIRLVLRKLLRNERGNSDMTVGLLLTAAGAAMVGLTVPMLYKSSDTAARTFDRQVKILERGAGGGSELPAGPGGLGTPGSFSGFSPPGVGGFELGQPAKDSTVVTTSNLTGK